MESVESEGVNQLETPGVNRRAVVGRLVIGGAAAALLGRLLQVVRRSGDETTPDGSCFMLDGL